MSYVPTAADFANVPDAPAAVAQGGAYVPTAADFANIPGPGEERFDPRQASAQLNQSLMSPTDVKLHDISAGIVNPWINLVNMIPHAHIPKMGAYKPHSVPAIAGQVAGGILPFVTGEGAVAEGAAALPKLAEALGIGGKGAESAQKIASLLGHASPVRSGMAGALSGAATADPGTRSSQALIQGAGAGALHGLGTLAGMGGRKLLSTPVMQKAARAFEPPITTGLPEDATQEATDAIAGNYARAKRKASDLYHDATGAATLKGVQFDKSDFPAYNEEYIRQAGDNTLPTRGVNTPKNLVKNPNEAILRSLGEEVTLPNGEPHPKLSTINPSQVHRERSKLLALGRASGDGLDKHHYNKLAQALKRDYFKKMDEVDPKLGDAYQKASDFYKNTIIDKFHEHSAFKKMRKALSLTQGLVPDENETQALYNLNWHGGQPQPVINSLIPKTASEGLSRLTSFQNDLMGGNHEATSRLAKNLLFSKYASPLTPGTDLTSEEVNLPDYKFNVHKFLNHYKKLGESQKEFLFKNGTKDVLDTLSPHSNALKKTGLLSSLVKHGVGGLAGLALASKGMLPVSKELGALIGTALSGPAEKGAEGAARFLLPSSMDKLLERLGPYKGAFRKSRVPVAMGTRGISNIIGGQQNAGQ